MDIGRVVRGYKFEKRLGRGSFAEVWVVSKDGKKYAAKVLAGVLVGKGEKNDGENLLANNIRLSCPYLLRYFESFNDSSDNLIVVMELCSKGDLGWFIKGLKEKGKGVQLSADRFMKIFIQLLLAVYELHDNKLLHRDINPYNIMLDDNDDVKIGGYHLIHFLDSTEGEASSLCGTPRFIAPEVLEGARYGKKADVFSLGVVMYYLATFNYPFDSPNTFLITQLVLKGEYAAIPKSTYSDSIRDIVHSMLTLNSKDRPSVEDLFRKPVIQEFAHKLDLLKNFPSAVDVALTAGGGGGGRRKGSIDFSSNSNSSSSSTTTNTAAVIAAAATAADDDVTEFIKACAANNPDPSSFRTADFRAEFEEVVGRKATVAEVTLFLKEQRKNRG